MKAGRDSRSYSGKDPEGKQERIEEMERKGKEGIEGGKGGGRRGGGRKQKAGMNSDH